MKQVERLVSLAIVVCSLLIASDCRASIETDTIEIKFRQSSVKLDSALFDNNRAISTLHHRLRELDADSTTSILGVEVVGTASPEGSLSFNQWLSHERALCILEIVRQSRLGGHPRLSERFTGRDWEGLARYVAHNENVPYRREVADLLNSGSHSDSLLLNLKRLRGGEPYAWLYRNVFPDLRRSSIILRYMRGVQPMMTEPPMLHTAFADIPRCIPTFVTKTTVEDEKKPFYMAIKSNMLFDALLVPHIGVEFYLGKNWSIAGQWMYAWWKSDRRHNYWRTYGGDIVVRRWFGEAAKRKPLTGHHLGVYAQIFTYDFELGGRGYIGGIPGGTLWDKANYGGGVEYGYSLPVGRRINIDFTLGAGYVTGKYYEYLPIDNHYVWQRTKKLHWFGPTKLEVSFVWLIGRGNVNEKGGGR